MARRATGFLAAASIIASILAASIFMAPASNDHGKTPVLFVHGHGLAPDYWAGLRSHLVTLGYPSQYLHAVDIRPRRASNVTAATEFIKPDVERLLAAAEDAAVSAGQPALRPARVDIVAHSMGAVSSRWYAARIAPQRVRTWISIAGANYGTDALCGNEDAGARELCPAFARSAEASSVQVALNGSFSEPRDATPYGLGRDPGTVVPVPCDAKRAILYYTVRQAEDHWIIPSRSAEISGAGGIAPVHAGKLRAVETSPGNFLLDRSYDHDSMPTEPEVWDIVAAMLSARDSGQPGDAAVTARCPRLPADRPGDRR